MRSADLVALWDRFLLRFHKPYQMDGYGTCCSGHLRTTPWPCPTIKRILERYDRRHQ